MGVSNDMIRVKARDVVARCGRWSGRQLRRMRTGVEVDGRWVALDDAVTIGTAWARFNFGPVALEARATLPPVVLLDKPLGAVTSRAADGGAPTVFDSLVPALAEVVQPVGRLDRDSSGLLLLVGDGRLIQHLGHPKRAIPRTYVVSLAEEPAAEAVEALRKGELELADGHRPRPTRVEPTDEGSWTVTLTEGKYHEVRRMFAAAGTRVTALRRTDFGGFTLDDLQGRPWRRLDEEEVRAAYARFGVPLPEAILEVREVDDGTAQG
jgi:16S rRNA pseudouridine516 synthase